MKTQLAKWGDSLAVRIPKSVARAAKLKSGDDLELGVQGEGSVSMQKSKRRVSEKAERRRYLEELVSRITPENRHEEIGFGSPVGKELW